ncbi:hypothetical protein [Halalkalibacter urbisdiaboli]|uniref:hypothetical protein n=1 Tax=Halalkalibacter urbisdiaboli TaxID=1960589 RepID=UPI00105455BD|nr:hypothetical protein [Halalkalibacter urbisdiaboli]
MEVKAPPIASNNSGKAEKNLESLIIEEQWLTLCTSQQEECLLGLKKKAEAPPIASNNSGKAAVVIKLVVQLA